MQRKKWMSIAAASLLITAAASAAPPGSRWGANYFPNVELTTHEGKKVRFYDDLLKGKTVAIYLMYTTCKFSCPLETARLAQVKKYLGDRVGTEIFFYSISIDPTRDTPEVLKKYAETYHAGKGWTFLTGDPKDIELISRKLGLYSEPDPDNPDGHTPSLLIGDEASGQWTRNSALDNPKFLALTIGNWLNSWKGNKLGTKSYEQATLLPKADPGHYLFATQCAACHTIGNGDSLGPDLVNVTNVRERAWLTNFVQKPQDMVSAGDPIALALFKKYKEMKMPNLGLTATETAAVIGFLESQAAAAAAQKSAPQAEAKVPAMPAETATAAPGHK